MVLDTLSMPGSDGVDRGAALSLSRPRFRRSAFESCIPLAASPPMSTTLIYRVCYSRTLSLFPEIDWCLFSVSLCRRLEKRREKGSRGRRFCFINIFSVSLLPHSVFGLGRNVIVLILYVFIGSRMRVERSQD